jgi:hypothetical protein
MFWKSLATLGFLGISLTTIRDTDTFYRTGLAPDSTVQVELAGTSIAKTVFSDVCSVLKVSLGDRFSTDLKVNGTTISPGSQGYKCVSTTMLSVEYPSTVTKNWPVNACGFVTIDSPNRASGFSATDTVKINGTQYSVSAIPIATKPPICRNGVLYQST